MKVSLENVSQRPGGGAGGAVHQPTQDNFRSKKDNFFVQNEKNCPFSEAEERQNYVQILGFARSEVFAAWNARVAGAGGPQGMKWRDHLCLTSYRRRAVCFSPRAGAALRPPQMQGYGDSHCV